MFRRLIYSVIRRPWKQVRQIFLYMVLFLFMMSASLTSSVSTLFDTVAGKSVDLNVTVKAPFIDTTTLLEWTDDYSSNIEEWLDAMDELSIFNGVRKSEYAMLAGEQFLKVGYIDDDGNACYYDTGDDFDLYRSTGSFDPNVVFNPYSSFQATQLYGVSTADSKIINNEMIRLPGGYSGRFFNEEEIANGEMVCVIPCAVLSRLMTPEGEKEQEIGDTLQIISNAVDINGVITSSKTWSLKIIGINQGAVNDGGMNQKIILPLNTMRTILTEAYDFQKTNSSFALENISSAYNVSALKPAVFELESLEDLKAFMKHIMSMDAYQKGMIQTDSSLNQYAPVLSNIYTITSSFSTIAILISVITLVFAMVTGCLECMYRRKEMAVLQAMGEKKWRIALQMAAEQSFQIVIAIMIALPSSLVVTRKFALYLFDQSVSETNDAIAKAMNSAFSIQNIKVTQEDVASLLRYTAADMALLAVTILLSVMAVILISFFFAKRFHARKLLGGAE